MLVKLTPDREDFSIGHGRFKEILVIKIMSQFNKFTPK